MLNRAQTAALVYARAVRAQADIEGMKVTNAERVRNNFAPAYTEQNFDEVIVRNLLGENDIGAEFRAAED